MSVADEGEHKQQNRNHQQPGGLGSVDRVALVPMLGIFLMLAIVSLRVDLRGGHADIVALYVAPEIRPGIPYLAATADGR